MNKNLALHMKTQLRVITQAYEGYLFKEITDGERKVEATEALVTRDLVRTMAMSEISKNRTDVITTRISPSESPTDTKEQGLIEELTRISSAGPTRADTVAADSSSDALFRNLEDCIPCNKKWDWGDFDWDRLKEILTLDIKARFKWLLDIEDLLNRNDVIEKLCYFLHAFKNLCPKDLLVLIALLLAFIAKTIESIKFNFDGALKDILAALLRPYINGLEDFLNAYVQFLVDQIDCILNVIQVSAEELRDLQISNELGPDSIHFKEDIFTGSADEFFQGTADVTKDTRKFLREKPREIAHFIGNDIPGYIVGLARDAADWLELQVIRTQDAVIDVLGGEWLITKKNISFIDQMKSVATLIQVLKIIYNLGNLDDLCHEDNVRKVIEEINRSQPDFIAIDEDRDPRSPFNSNDRPGIVSNQERSPDASQENNPRSNITIGFSLSSCLKRTDEVGEDQLRQWIAELS